MTSSSTARAPGLWDSPVTPQMLARGLRLSDVAWNSDGATLVWLEGRSDQGVLVSSGLDGDAARDLTDSQSVRARVGYGGGDFGVGGGYIFFVSGGRLYRQALAGGGPQAITPAFGDLAAPAVSPDGRWVLYVYSYQRSDGLAIADASGKQWPQQVASGHDFYMQPRWSPRGNLVAWIAWNHPLMPWDGSTLYLADLDDRGPGLPTLKNIRAIAGSDNVAVLQPEFSSDGRYLSYLSDEGGWHNLYLYDVEGQMARRLTHTSGAQLGCAAWDQGLRTYGWSHDTGALYYVRNERGFSSLWRHDLRSGENDVVVGLEGYTNLEQPALNPVRPLLAVIASSGTQPAQLVTLELNEKSRMRIVKRSSSENVPPQALVAPQPITWKGADGAEVHGLLYSPSGGASQPHPPAIVRIHGGPTGQHVAAFSSEIQFFVTRGYIVLEVNYRGSTGYGRAYMEALRGNWGIHDIQDAISGARHLVESGLADGGKLVIMGGSAGGFTVLQTMVQQPGFFKAGVCCYGVSNMFTLAADTHKFEERYLDTMLGPLPQAGQVYRERSPIFQIDRLVDPIAIFQGEEDQVVPRAQSDTIIESLRRRGVQHEYHVYAGEGHGWRKQETIEAYYKAVEAFLKQHVLFA